MRYFAYCRKSTESEERQALSIPAQRDEIARIREKFPDIEIVEIFEEARTAKAPGRPVFNKMMERIGRGDADGIIAWHPDRLARNSIDGGLIIYQLDRGTLKDLKFSTYSFENSSQGKFMLQIMFGYSKYYVDSLSENVRRGIRKKLEDGKLPGLAPMGYINDPVTRGVIPDPKRFAQVRAMWDMLLTGQNTVRGIWEIADREWGFRTLQRARSGGKRVALSMMYKMFNSRFYSGTIVSKGIHYAGRHIPMIKPEEFEFVQKLIRREAHIARQRHHFAFTSIITCGSCGCAITAEVQTNAYGRQYVYYRCTKKRTDLKCPERYVSAKMLEQQILTYLRSLELPAELLEWAKKQEAADLLAHKDLKEQYGEQSQKELADTQASLSNLTDLRIRSLIEDGEFVEKRALLTDKIAHLNARLGSEPSGKNRLELLQSVISFRNCATKWFADGSDDAKRQILKLVGSNFVLSAQKLSFEAADFCFARARGPDIPTRRGLVDYVRTFSSEPESRVVVESIKYLAHLQAANDNGQQAVDLVQRPQRPHVPDEIAVKHRNYGSQAAA